MDAGQLDRRVKLMQVVETQNAVGEVVLTYTEVATLWAHIKPLTGRELFAANQVVAEATRRIFIRWRSDVTEKHKIEYEGELHDILHISEYGRKDGLELMVKKP